MKKMNLKERAKNLKTDVPAVCLALKHRKTPVLAKIFAALAVLYALSPVDLIPDFIPVIGCLDDLLFVPALIAAYVKLIPSEVWEECRKNAKNMALSGKWYYAVPVVLIWMFLIFLVIKIIFL